MPKPKDVPVGSGTTAEVAAPTRKRRRFSPAEKLRIVRAAQECTEPGQIGELLRREGLHSSHLTAWRRALETHGVEGMAAQKRGRKTKLDAKDRKVAELEKRAARLEKELALAHDLLDLQKKVSRLLGVTLPPERE